MGCGGDQVVIKWSACSPSDPMIRVRIPLKPTVFSAKLMFEKNKNKQKEAMVGPFFQKINKLSFYIYIWRST